MSGGWGFVQAAYGVAYLSLLAYGIGLWRSSRDKKQARPTPEQGYD